MAAPTPLKRLLEAPSPPLDELALALSAELRPETDVEGARRALDAVAGAAGPHLEGVVSELRQAHALCDTLHRRLGLAGERDDYHDPRNSHLDLVLSRGRGLPITLTVLYAGVGRRVGVDVFGVGFPGHFLGRVGQGTLIDPFDGRVLDEGALRTLAARVLGSNVEVPARLLAPASAKEIATRMLVNLARAHARRGDYARALLAANQLVEITGEPEHVRDRGRLAAQLGAYAQAAEDFEAYLGASADAGDAARVRAELEVARARTARSLQ